MNLASPEITGRFGLALRYLKEARECWKTNQLGQAILLDCKAEKIMTGVFSDLGMPEVGVEILKAWRQSSVPDPLWLSQVNSLIYSPPVPGWGTVWEEEDV